MAGYVVDTNIINRLVDETFPADALPAEAELIASHIQIDELNRTSNEDRCENLATARVSGATCAARVQREKRRISAAASDRQSVQSCVIHG